MNKTIFIVDDDTLLTSSLSKILIENGYTAITAATPDAFLNKVADLNPAVVILDIFFGHGQLDGEDLVVQLTENYPNIQSIMISGESDMQKVLNCLKKGAGDFIEKPISLPRILTAVRNAVNTYHAKNATQTRINIIGKSKAIYAIKQRIQKLAALNETILIYGESGCGKEIVAENLHLFSNRYTQPLYKVNCTSLNFNLIESELFGHKKGSFTGAYTDKKGLFTIANDSTLFIDEIGDFPLELQSKILRVVQEKSFTPVGGVAEIRTGARLVFATNKDLEKMIAAGAFRSDLFYRLSTFLVVIPPLRERLEDIDDLATFFLHQFLVENNLTHKYLSPGALKKLKDYNYPGNVRELIKIVKNAAFFCDTEEIRAEDIDFGSGDRTADIWFITKDKSLHQSKNIFESELIKRRLKKYNYDLTETAASFNIIRNNLYRKLKQLGISFKQDQSD
jgi:two-component system nitrogen regulation response regulator NtrX